MKPDTRTFLALVRDAQDPTAADEARVLLALRATLAAGATSSAVASATLQAMRRARPGAALGARGPAWTLGSKGMLGVMIALGASFGTGDTSRPAPALEARAAPAQPGAVAFAAPSGPASSGNDAPRPPEPALERLAAAPTDRPQEAARAAPARARRASAPGAPRASAPSGLRAELDLLGRVQQLLRQGDAAGALRALDAHHTNDRVLLAERRAARILALCGLGRTAQARAAAAEFEREHPDSVQRAMVARSCASSGRPLEP